MSYAIYLTLSLESPFGTSLMQLTERSRMSRLGRRSTCSGNASSLFPPNFSTLMEITYVMFSQSSQVIYSWSIGRYIVLQFCLNGPCCVMYNVASWHYLLHLVWSHHVLLVTPSADNLRQSLLAVS